MQTIILPGFSVSNKSWAEDIVASLSSQGQITMRFWKHWQTGTTAPDWINKEVEEIITQMGDSKVNLLAKSIGTLITTKLLEKAPEKINKIILCGIPTSDFTTSDLASYNSLNNLSPEKILCIQNEFDNHGSFDETKAMVQSINPKIVVISKPRSDHNYPFTDDFKGFLAT